MDTRLLLVGSLIAGLLGCSSARVEPTQPPPAPAAPVVAGSTALLPLPPESLAATSPPTALWSYRVPVPKSDETFEGRICHVGDNSCLEMDDRPFETCLLSAQDCGEKLRESLRRGESFVLQPPKPKP